MLGRVKSRIAVETGKEKALSIYLQLLEHVFNQFNHSSSFDICCYSDQPEHIFFDRYKSHGIKLFQQNGEDLGQRMYGALVNEINDSSSVVLIGSDCPAINKAVIEDAFQKLSSGCQSVIAPADDGGYVLIGFSKIVFTGIECSLSRQVFENIDWGTEKVFQQTIEVFENLNVKACHLEMMADIDTFADYQKWQTGLNNQDPDFT